MAVVAKNQAQTQNMKKQNIIYTDICFFTFSSVTVVKFVYGYIGFKKQVGHTVGKNTFDPIAC